MRGVATCHKTTQDYTRIQKTTQDYKRTHKTVTQDYISRRVIEWGERGGVTRLYHKTTQDYKRIHKTISQECRHKTTYHGG